MSEVPPTRMNQQVFKGKKKAAESGHKLLKKKADALKVRFAIHILDILEESKMTELMDMHIHIIQKYLQQHA